MNLSFLRKKILALTFLQRFFLCLIVGLIVLSVPFSIRLFDKDPFFIFSNSGYHLRLISEQETGFTFHDPLFERPFLFTPYHVIFSLFNIFFSLPLSFMIIHITIFTATFYLLLSILRFFSVSPVHQLLFTLLFILSPATLFLYTTVSPVVLSLFLLVFLTWALLQEHPLWISIVCAILLPFFGFSSALIGFFCLLALGKKRQKISLIILILISASFFITLLVKFGASAYFHLTSFESFFADLSVNYSYSIFALLLALIGVSVTWRMKKTHKVYYTFLLLGLFLPFFLQGLIPYQNIFVCLAASYGFVYLYKRKWHLENIRFLSLLLIICGLLFTGIATHSHLVKEQPDASLIRASFWIQEKAIQPSVIFTDPSLGSWVAYVSKHEIFLDDQQLFFSDYNNRLQVAHRIMTSTSFSELPPLLDYYHITYILLTQEQQQDITYNHFFFILDHTENFKKVYENSLFTLWEYHGV